MATSDVDQHSLSTLRDYQNEYDGQDENEHDEDGLSAMSLVDHLEELRWRILKVLIVVAIGSVVAFIFRNQLMTFLEAPLPGEANALHSLGGKLVVMGLTEGFTVTLLISVIAGFIVSLPFLLYQAWAFISPGLYRREKKNAVPFMIIGVVLFCMGVSLGYVMLRYPVEWFISFSSGSDFTNLVTAGSYFSFVAIFILVFGLIFELPLVLTFLAQTGIVSVDTLRKKRVVAHLVMWGLACFATPGADVYSPLIIGTVMSCLYELSIIFIRIVVKSDNTNSARQPFWWK